MTPAGTKTFLLQHQLDGRDGRRVRMVVGRYGEPTPAQARKSAETARGLVLAGRDPEGERRAAVATANAAEAERRRQSEADALSRRALVDSWAELGLADRSAKHRAEAPRAICTCFPGLLDRPAHAVDVAAVQRVLDARHKPVMARRARDYGRALFNWAIRRQLLTSNSLDGVVIERRETSRDRVMTDAELGEAWRAAGQLGFPFGPFIRLLMLTLQRRGELAEWAGESCPGFGRVDYPTRADEERQGACRPSSRTGVRDTAGAATPERRAARVSRDAAEGCGRTRRQGAREQVACAACLRVLRR